jgi:membrane protein YqaA with SNARE-associated domain
MHWVMVMLVLLIAWLITFLINIVPFFMPPTWTVLAFFRIHDHLPIWLLTPGGAFCATAGRCLLALATRRMGTRILPARQRENVAHLGAFIARKRWTYIGVLFYAFGPIPSPHLFIAAGLVGADLRLIAAAFFVGRLVSYTALVAGAGAAADQLGSLFSGQFGTGIAVIGPITALLMIALLLKVDWSTVLDRWQDTGEMERIDASREADK